MKYSELKSHLNNAVNGGEFAAAYFLTGEDEYLLHEAKRLFGEVLDAGFKDMNFSKTSDVGEAIETLYTFPVFDAHRVCVLEKDVLSEDDTTKLKTYLDSPAAEAILVADVGEGAKLFKGKHIESVSCAPLSDEELRDFVREQFASPPAVSAETAAVEELITRTQGSLARIVGEVKKLKAYTPDGVTRADVTQMVASDIEYQTYILSEAVANRDAQKALSVTDAILKSGIPERVLLSAIYERYRRMLHISLNKGMSNEQLAKIFGFKKPGQVYFLKKSADNYSQVRLKAIVDHLHSLQYEIVSGERSESSALYDAVLTLLATQ